MPVNYGHHRSDRMAALLNPVNGIRDAQRRRGITPHDFAKDNRAQLKAMQKVNRERRDAALASASASAIKGSAKYSGIESRVTAALSRPATADPALPPRKAPEPKPFACPKPSGPPGRVFTAWAPPPLLFEGTTEPLPGGPRKPPVPRRDGWNAAPPASGIDFVKRNAELSSLTPRRASAAAASPPGTGGKSRTHGRVPTYLLDRKLELAQAAQKAAAAARPPECPEGTHILEEEERVRVLGLVKKGQERVHAELDRMPFVVDSYGLKAKHEALYLQLSQLEAAEKAFSRKKVIVHDDEPLPVDELPPPLPPPLEKQLTDRLKTVLDAQLDDAAPPTADVGHPTADLTVEEL